VQPQLLGEVVEVRVARHQLVVGRRAPGAHLRQRGYSSGTLVAVSLS
jgi:hypothetical protein